MNLVTSTERGIQLGSVPVAGTGALLRLLRSVGLVPVEPDSEGRCPHAINSVMHHGRVPVETGFFNGAIGDAQPNWYQYLYKSGILLIYGRLTINIWFQVN